VDTYDYKFIIVLFKKACTSSRKETENSSIQNFLNKESKDRFKLVLKGLDAMGIKYVINPHLVRGLDYYQHTAFEFVEKPGTHNLGKQQTTVIAGGRYDGLVENLGGPDIPGIGWACGIERLALVLMNKKYEVSEEFKDNLPIFVASITSEKTSPAKNQELETYVNGLRQSLRRSSFPIFTNFHEKESSLSKQMRKVSDKCSIAILVGEDELRTKSVSVKNLLNGVQELVNLNELYQKLREIIKQNKRK